MGICLCFELSKGLIRYLLFDGWREMKRMVFVDVSVGWMHFQVVTSIMYCGQVLHRAPYVLFVWLTMVKNFNYLIHFVSTLTSTSSSNSTVARISLNRGKLYQPHIAHHDTFKPFIVASMTVAALRRQELARRLWQSSIRIFLRTKRSG